jgi:hypothetical protein
VCRFLAQRRALAVLDNWEHVIDAASGTVEAKAGENMAERGIRTMFFAEGMATLDNPAFLITLPRPPISTPESPEQMCGRHPGAGSVPSPPVTLREVHLT